MKAVLIGSDFLLDDNGDAKLVELNTSAGIFQSMMPHLDFSGLENLLQTNSIAELVYIFNDQQVVTDPNFRANLSLGLRLQTICEALGIAYTPYQVSTYATTVPYIEDAPNKFILRQAFDSTALIDDEYCTDKLNLKELVEGQPYAITAGFDSTKAPNVVVKSKNPSYDGKVYPEVHTVANQDEFDTLQQNVTDPYFIQEFINSENNIIQGRYSIIRSMDLVYGSNLDTLHLGSYHQTSPYKLDIWPDTLQAGKTALENKSRIKWISKQTTDLQKNVYHVDEDTNIALPDGSYITIQDVEEGTVVKSAQFSNFPTGSTVDVLTYSSSFEEMRDSLQVNSASVVEFISSSLETVYLNVTLENGINWDESIRSTIYTEASGSAVTQFKALGQVEVGDKVILLNVATNELIKKEVTALDPVYDTKMVYELDVEEQDIFLSILDQDIALVQHNPCWCNGYNCGWWSCYQSCWTCQNQCFIGEALVTTVDGEKQIKDIEVGDLVQSFDLLTNELVTKKVKGLWKSDYDNKLVIINGTHTKATIGHPFAIKDFEGNIKWAAVDPEADKDFHNDLIIEKLEVGKYFINLAGTWVLVESIEFEDFKGIVYNISVEDTQNYIAEGILVHNMAKKLQQ
jgi:hypothetical protein